MDILSDKLEEIKYNLEGLVFIFVFLFVLFLLLCVCLSDLTLLFWPPSVVPSGSLFKWGGSSA